MNDSPFDADPPLSETDLHAFADGRLASRRAAQVGAYLRGRPQEARRIAFYGRLNERIRHAFPPAGESLPPARPRSRGLRRIAAKLPPRAAALLLALAAAGGWLAAIDVSSMALNNAALMALMDPTAGRDTQRAPSPADLAAAPNLSSAGLRLVSLGSMRVGLVARAARYVYRSESGATIVLLSAPSLNVPPRPQWIAHRVRGYRLLMWTHVARRYVIAGAASAPGITRAADALTDPRDEP